jgi:hypothetical protein
MGEGRSPDESLDVILARLNGRVLGLVCGVVSALVLFVGTNWLVVKGGERVGPHLGLLGQFFIGYTVTFPGSFVGAGYAFVCGYLAGWLVAWTYNRVVDLRR